MQISSNMPASNGSLNSIKTNFTQKLSKEEALEIKEQITQNSNAIALKSVNVQGSLVVKEIDFKEAQADFQSFLKDIGYEGKPLAELSQEEAAELVSEDGLFGIKETSQRIAGFVISGANGDEQRLRDGREGMMQGFAMAKEMWGGELPEISQKTMQAAIDMVDKEMYDRGYSILNQEV